MFQSFAPRPASPNSKPRTPGDPRLVATYRLQFWGYSVRHILGAAFFTYLAWQAFALGVPIVGGAIAVFGAVYTGFVAVNIRKLYRAWRTNERIGRERTGGSTLR